MEKVPDKHEIMAKRWWSYYCKWCTQCERNKRQDFFLSRFICILSGYEKKLFNLEKFVPKKKFWSMWITAEIESANFN